MLDINGQPLGPSTTKYNYNYVTVPMLARASFGKNVQFFVNAGPYIGGLLSTITYFTVSNKTYKSNVTQYNKRVDAGITSGICVSIPFATKYVVTAEERNNVGLLNISKNVVNNQSIKTNSFVALIGFGYRV
jgi:hypothetical protein